MTAGPLTIGTAGHIDHGKTELIKALTGVDTDRLPDEQRRGISIELGYAKLRLPSGAQLSVIDVPGHERFVRTMVSGATGIDMYLMVIAADDGVMPQTREHTRVLEALGVGAGVIAITKSDLADPELAMIEASELLPGAELVAVSARTGQGLDQLRAALDRIAARLRSRAAGAGPPRLNIDRVFSIRGAGTVVTGTLWSGTITRGDEIVLLPGPRKARVRALQVHDEPRESAEAGQRLALNLSGVPVAAIARGDVLTVPGAALSPTYLVDAELRLGNSARKRGAEREPGDGARWAGAGEPEHGDRVHVHHGTREAPARLAWLGGRFWQLRLERALIVAAGDRLVIRRIAPPDTVGGGTVLDPHPRRHGASRELMVRLGRLTRGDADDAGRAATEPERSGARAASAPLIAAAGSRPLTPSALALEERLREAGVEPPLDSQLDPGDLAALRDAGRAVRVSKTLHYHPGVLEDVRRRVIRIAAASGGAVTLAQVRDELGTSRKFAQALLEHLDAERVTIRRGDAHHVRSAAAGAGD